MVTQAGGSLMSQETDDGCPVGKNPLPKMTSGKDSVHLVIMSWTAAVYLVGAASGFVFAVFWNEHSIGKKLDTLSAAVLRSDGTKYPTRYSQSPVLLPAPGPMIPVNPVSGDNPAARESPIMAPVQDLSATKNTNVSSGLVPSSPVPGKQAGQPVTPPEHPSAISDTGKVSNPGKNQKQANGQTFQWDQIPEAGGEHGR